MARLSSKAILSLRYTPAGSGIRRAAGRFLRYIAHRDQPERLTRDGVDGFLRYAAYRDRTAAEPRLFDARGDVGKRERRLLTEHIVRSVAGLNGHGRTPARAMYRLVLSPEDARGIDLRQLTRTVMGQLEKDAGTGGLGPWIAAVHKNTAHPHVHVVLAARRELAPGRFRGLVITRERLKRMKFVMGRELVRQRGQGFDISMQRLGRARLGLRLGSSLLFELQRAGQSLQRHYQREMERSMKLQREDELEHERDLARRLRRERELEWDR